MKRLVLTVLLLAGSIISLAEQKPDEILKLLQTNRVSLNYDCTVGKELPVRYTGKAILQKGAFRLSGNGLEIYCNGTELVCVDEKAKEIIVEKAGTIESYVKENVGKVSDIKFSNVSTAAISEDLSLFSYDWKSKDRSWVVTDMRQ